MEESLPSDTPRISDLPSLTVLETRVGGGVAARLPPRESRGGVTAVAVEVAAAVRPFSTRISLPFAEDGAVEGEAEEFLFTKRRSRGS